MKKRRNFWSADTLIIILLVVCVMLLGLIAWENPAYLLPAGVMALALVLLVFLFLGVLRWWVRRLIGGKTATASAEKSGLAALPVPAVAVNGKSVVWYNDPFRALIAGDVDVSLIPLNKLVPGLETGACATPEGQNIEVNGRKFTVHGNTIGPGQGLFFAVFTEDTQLKNQAAEYLASRPSVMHIVIDTYDEILKELRESERTRIMSDINLALEKYIVKPGGFLRKTSSARYIAVVEERVIATMVEKRFDILDMVRRSAEDASLISLSIGIGRQGGTLRECEEMAVQALDMALGRGGDQVALKSPDGFEFYGGVNRSVEKRTRVKSRIVAENIKTLVAQSDRVLIMGHKLSDMDSVGAAVGMLRFCKICRREAAIVLDHGKTNAKALVEYMQHNGCRGDFLMPQTALPLSGKGTLLIVVDTHMKHMLESEAIYQRCGTVVVIDHHRKMVGHIDNAAVFFHEPYASSASELVSELLPFAGKEREERPTPADAEALLAGIMLDTRTFSLHVGVRTFEAAAYLRRMGARTEVVKQMFATSLKEYASRSHLVEEAEIFEGCAIVVSENLPDNSEVVAAQAANDLLTIEGVRASFVAVLQDDVVRVSARSMGEVNVQLVMEKLGGGGHLTMAGAQLQDVTYEVARTKILRAVSEYLSENRNRKPPKDIEPD